MFQALQTLLAVCASLSVTLVSNANGTITVTVIPKSNKGSENSAALNTPLSLTGTPEELDAEFVSILSKYTDSHKSLAEQLETTEAILEAAKKEAATKATKAVTKGKTSGQATSEPDEEEVEEVEGGTNTGSQSGSATATDGSAPAAGPGAAAPGNIWEE